MNWFSCKLSLKLINNFLFQRIRNQIRKCPDTFVREIPETCSWQQSAKASNLDWLAKESPSNSFEKHPEACFGGKNCAFFAKKLITQFRIIEQYFASMFRRLQFTFPDKAIFISCVDQKLSTLQAIHYFL